MMIDNRQFTPDRNPLAQLARTQNLVMASLLALFQAQERLNEAELAAFLQADDYALERLAVCGRPRMAAVYFRSDVEQIAASSTVDAWLCSGP